MKKKNERIEKCEKVNVIRCLNCKMNCVTQGKSQKFYQI